MALKNILKGKDIADPNAIQLIPKNLLDFSQYQRARLQFCDAIAEYALKPANVTFLEQNGAIDLILPLITDRELSVRLSATCCLGRMANHSLKCATTLVEKSAPQFMLRELVDDRNNHILLKRAILQSLKSIAKHTPELANQIVQCGGLSAFLICLEEQDVMVNLSTKFKYPTKTNLIHIILVKRGSCLWNWMLC